MFALQPTGLYAYQYNFSAISYRLSLLLCPQIISVNLRGCTLQELEHPT